MAGPRVCAYGVVEDNSRTARTEPNRRADIMSAPVFGALSGASEVPSHKSQVTSRVAGHKSGRKSQVGSQVTSRVASHKSGRRSQVGSQVTSRVASHKSGRKSQV